MTGVGCENDPTSNDTIPPSSLLQMGGEGIAVGTGGGGGVRETQGSWDTARDAPVTASHCSRNPTPPPKQGERQHHETTTKPASRPRATASWVDGRQKNGGDDLCG